MYNRNRYNMHDANNEISIGNCSVFPMRIRNFNYMMTIYRLKKIVYYFIFRAILEIKTSLAFPVFQWLLYLVVLIWFFIVAIYLSSMKLYVFKVKGLANDHDCFCNYSYYKVPIYSGDFMHHIHFPLYFIWYLIVTLRTKIIITCTTALPIKYHYKHKTSVYQYILISRQPWPRWINVLKQSRFRFFRNQLAFTHRYRFCC